MALTPHMLVVQPVMLGAAIGTVTGPLGFELFGAAGTAPVVLEVVQVTVTLPATNFTVPELVAETLAPAGETVVDPAACAGPIPKAIAAAAQLTEARAARV
ncbi:hypothetical protein [Nocardia caishijiensis]|uniref:hypothetical protein n=1 Tax=Nocardia caishijiensis TaxID=184756 RepID=UPI001F3E22D2|nr:hypothetical protein [Nocardia caishijiensis]